jgi:ribosome-associated translation inhibitor RaiA
MQIQINTDATIDPSEAPSPEITAVVEKALKRFGTQVTRVEVHIGDENSHKGGGNDKRCAMEVRLAGRDPMAVTHKASRVSDAVNGAATKMTRSIEKVLGRLRER